MKQPTPPTSKRTGFALVSTVILIGIVGLLLVAMARLSVNRSMDVIAETHEIESRWLVASAQRALFQSIEDLLASNQLDQLQPTSREINLSTDEFSLEIIAADESAKLDINNSQALGSNAAQYAREFSNLPVELINLNPKIRNRDSKDLPFQSWDQVFASNESPLPPQTLMQTTGQLTCWGKRVNVRSAPDDILFESCKLAAGSTVAQLLVNARKDLPAANVDTLVNGLPVSAERKRQLRSTLTDSSISQSIWIKVTHEPSNRTTYWLVIREGFLTQNSNRVVTHRYQAFRW